MAKKPTPAEKKMIKKYEKDVSDEKKLLGSIEKIHKEDKSVFSLFRRLFGRKARRGQAKSAIKRRSDSHAKKKK